MPKLALFALFILTSFITSSQVMKVDSTNAPLNAANSMITNSAAKKVTLGAYAQIDYNQQFGDTVKHVGKMDVHRLVALIAYSFNQKTSFVTELEIEHVKEIYVEQAFINYSIIPSLNLRAGLLLIPMGIINEYHEPPTFNGVERPNIDGKIIPTTWREMGLGLAGRIDRASMRYQVYVVNGFLGYDGEAKLRGSDGFRKGRQKAAESVFSSPNLTAKVEHYGLPGLKLGLSGYLGDSQSTAIEGAPNSSDGGGHIDSTIVNLAMAAFDLRYTIKGFSARGQVVYGSIGNSGAYNQYLQSDLGSAMFGYYGELAYDLLSFCKTKSTQQLVAFVRYESYDTHHSTEMGTEKNKAFDRSEITGGLGWHLAPGAVLKGDLQLLDTATPDTDPIKQFNLGIGIWF
jgi:hypothetical protein